MIRVIFLLSPVFISLFWAITLAGDKTNHSVPRGYLAKFMLFPFFCFAVHFMYFAPLPKLFPYFDVPLQLVGSLIFPIFYIYFRLLTVDDKFSIKVHKKYLIIPTLIPILYGIAVLFAPKIEYRTWLYNPHAFPESSAIYILSILRKLTYIQFLLLIAASYIGSYLLLKKYGTRAEQYYSDINDGSTNNAKLLSHSILVVCVVTFVAAVVGRYFIITQEIIIYVIWSIFAATLYFIGYMGLKQKPVNPTFDMEDVQNNYEVETVETSQYNQKKAHQKIIQLFEVDKIYLNNQLNIMDVANAVGTNRTYISVLINVFYNQNFCSFVNTFRMAELEKAILQNPKSSYESFIQSCGFGSVNSMKRSVTHKTGLTIAEWKKELLLKQP